MTQYEIWWADLPVPVGRRPVLLLTRPGAYSYLSRITVVEITTTVRGIPQEVRLGRRDGLSQPSVANFDNMHVVAKQLLAERIGRASAHRVPEFRRALGYAFGWPELAEMAGD